VAVDILSSPLALSLSSINVTPTEFTNAVAGQRAAIVPSVGMPMATKMSDVTLVDTTNLLILVACLLESFSISDLPLFPFIC
jgi:hypothetical protein